MPAFSLWPYKFPSTHKTISAIIQKRSSNDTDVRQAALKDLDLSSAKRILDLGCGFGFMSESLARGAAADACLVGVDFWESNKTPFLKKVTATGRQGEFVCMKINSELPWKDCSFDLVVCSYSLYFFANALPEISRILAPRGQLLATTHSESSVLALLEIAGADQTDSVLLSLIRKFSSENGHFLLAKYFGEITQKDYYNSLTFDSESVDELLSYLKFKLPFFIPDSKPDDELPGSIADYAQTMLSRLGKVVLEKNDTTFRCRSPLCCQK